MKNLVILGSSGSIGRNALDVVKRLKDYKVVGLAVHSNVKALIEQIRAFQPEYAAVFDENSYLELKKSINKKTKILAPGIEGLCELASINKADIVLNSLSGAIGLAPLIASIKSAKKIALANKEPMVMAGELLMAECDRWGASIIPVDSEPSAIFQCLQDKVKPQSRINKIFLTASGGPFYKYKGDFSKIKIEDALKHPKWKMGKKITIDSATLMNKGLEAIEIKNLFKISIDKIEILIHPQSIIHSAVEFKDNSVLAQISNPDMRLPIQYALTYPERFKSPVKPMNFFDIARLEFFKPDFKKFPLLKMAIEASKKGGIYPAILNAANEEAVNAFLLGKIKFTDIAKIVSKTLAVNKVKDNRVNLSEIVEIDDWARRKAREFI